MATPTVAVSSGHSNHTQRHTHCNLAERGTIQLQATNTHHYYTHYYSHIFTFSQIIIYGRLRLYIWAKQLVLVYDNMRRLLGFVIVDGMHCTRYHPANHYTI